MNQRKPALAALLLTIAHAMPAVAQQSLITPHLPSELCSGCFAYLEFPPLHEAEATSTLASAHQHTLAPTTAAQQGTNEAPTLGVVAVANQ